MKAAIEEYFGDYVLSVISRKWAMKDFNWFMVLRIAFFDHRKHDEIWYELSFLLDILQESYLLDILQERRERNEC